MPVTLTNDFLTVMIAEKGAELTSIVNNHTAMEYLWQADPEVWGRHAPVLFPIVGALKNGRYTYQGKTYEMGQHGFARDRDFTLVDQTPTRAVFTLTDDAETRTNYPFAFKLTITTTLENNAVRVTYQVENPDDEAPLYFSIGGHPGFQIPVDEDTIFSDYYLAFTPRKSLVTIPLKVDAGIDYAHRTLAATDVNQQLSHDLFQNDAVIYALNSKTTLAVRSDKTAHGVALTTDDAPYLGLWSPYPQTGEFVCIEPWWGIADTIDASGELTEKLGIQHLAPGAVFERGYSIAIH